jgi:hypothetical protein
MVFPIIGLAAALATATGAYGLYWYHSLSKEEQEEADRTAMAYARELYNKGLHELTAKELHRVHELVKREYAS